MTPDQGATAVAQTVPDGSVAVVMAWVNEDPATRAPLAMAAERNREGGPRSSLVAQLEPLLPKSDPAASPDGTIRETSQVDARPGINPEPELCTEHFPAGWNSAVITRTEQATGARQPSVTCEHGTYHRPVKQG